MAIFCASGSALARARHGSLNIASSDLLETPIPLPQGDSALAEQRKVAECLESLDELIAAETEKLEALKQHKKGLLQQLFPAEGETTPRLRFPRFQAFPDWKPLAFADALNDYFYGTSKACGTSGDYKVLRMANMFDGGLHVRNLTYTDLSPKEFETLRLHAGDFLLNRTNSIDLVGRVSLFDLEGDYVTASYIVVFRLKAELVDSRYCNYFLNTPASQRLIRSMATRTVSQANVNPSSVPEELPNSAAKLERTELHCRLVQRERHAYLLRVRSCSGTPSS